MSAASPSAPKSSPRPMVLHGYDRSAASWRALGRFCFGATPKLADICLVPQLGNARRFGVDVSRFPRLLTAETARLALPAFANATPARQPDAE